ncbi:hypothetical protein DXC12_08225 [Melissococcus sp. OM08-11BH]|nr:transposase [Melissococcus sp. OM08-11BH]RGI29386.1 hypothetical protein DXC12_08225 [Melissococcus sp. OM08-11BH]
MEKRYTKWLILLLQQIKNGTQKKTGKLYKQRKIDIEPAIRNLKTNLPFTRFSVRGKDKVVNELVFTLMTINIRKLTSYR